MVGTSLERRASRTWIQGWIPTLERKPPEQRFPELQKGGRHYGIVPGSDRDGSDRPRGAEVTADTLRLPGSPALPLPSEGGGALPTQLLQWGSSFPITERRLWGGVGILLVCPRPVGAVGPWWPLEVLKGSP